MLEIANKAVASRSAAAEATAKPTKEKSPAMIISAIAASATAPSPRARPQASRSRDADSPSFESEQAAVDKAIADAARGVSEALRKAVRHFRGEEIWAIGTMPDCAPALDVAEQRIQRIVANSQFSASQIEEAAVRLKDLADLRAAARTARQGVQLAWLLRQRGGEAAAYPLIQPIADITCRVATEASEALSQVNAAAARLAALHYRLVEEARCAGEVRTMAQFSGDRNSLLTRRLTLASIRFMAVGGEAFARVAARAANRSSAAATGSLHSTL